MQKSRWCRLITQNLHDSQCTNGSGVARAFRNLETQPHMRLPGQVIELCWLNTSDHSANRCGIVKIRVVKKQSLLIDVGIAIQML